MARAFRRDKEYIHVIRRNDLSEMQREPVRNAECFALLQMWRDLAAIGFAVTCIGNRHHNHVGGLGGIGNAQNLYALTLRHLGGLTAFVEADNDFHAAILEIERVGVAL